MQHLESDLAEGVGGGIVIVLVFLDNPPVNLRDTAGSNRDWIDPDSLGMVLTKDGLQLECGVWEWMCWHGAVESSAARTDVGGKQVRPRSRPLHQFDIAGSGTRNCPVDVIPKEAFEPMGQLLGQAVAGRLGDPE